MIDFLIQLGVPEQWAGDVALLLLIVLAALLLIVFVKRRNLGGFLISSYIAFVITTKSAFSFLDNASFMAIYFLVIALVVFSFFNRHFKINITGKRFALWSKTILFALAIVGFLISIIMAWFPPEVVTASFSPFSVSLFLSEGMQLFWAVVPMFLVLFFKYRQ